MNFLASAIQFHPQLGEMENNIQRLEAAVEQSASSGARLIVTPELATSGYMYKERKNILPFSDTIPGETTDRFHRLCVKWNSYLVLGMPEYDKETGLLYNSAVLIGPEGYIGKYRKTHLWEAEAHWATPGNLGFPVFYTEIGKIAINICMDAVYMESSRIPALNGADILAFPTNSSAQTISMLQGWATLNGMYVVSSNRADEEEGFQMAGASAIWSPYGEKLVEANTSLDGGNEEIIYAVIDPAHYLNPNKERLLRRRPDIYKSLMLHIGPWNYRKSLHPAEVTIHCLSGPAQGELKSLSDFFAYWAAQVTPLREKDKYEGVESLFVLPALSATGFVSHLPYEELVLLSQRFAVEWLPEYQIYAQTLEANLVVSAPECADGNVYLSAWIINSSGEIEHVHRSTHLREEEMQWATPGDDLITVPIKGLGRVGVIFEEEGYYPEVTTSYGIQRADVVALLAGEHSDEEYAPLIKDAFHANGKDRKTLKAVWENLAMSIQAYIAFAAWEKSDGTSTTAVYAVDPYYEKEKTAAARNGTASKKVTTLRNEAWYNQQQWIVSRRVEHYYPLISEGHALAPALSPQEEDDMMA
ncbi:nitrilase [Salipaludibacillus sp. CUR1]|uniref:nitrilase-related carbon-nitrogen hydrolase n=1 Tax=Salipaludibacillus sp. CUR1 TaxID=2820003 RepID=UPI001E40C800|nr:nitrilase-related carbon-nitrogen hydrolase [Salipaludibacillus sp. CUR1]MCE7791599.1 nitrilase [Salipaludibacillus sp. CUR1]